MLDISERQVEKNIWRQIFNLSSEVQIVALGTLEYNPILLLWLDSELLSQGNLTSYSTLVMPGLLPLYIFSQAISFRVWNYFFFYLTFSLLE